MDMNWRTLGQTESDCSIALANICRGQKEWDVITANALWPHSGHGQLGYRLCVTGQHIVKNIGSEQVFADWW